MRRHKKFDGQLSLLWVMCYCCERLITELFRGDVRGGMLSENIALSFVIAAVLITLSVILYPVMRRKNRITPDDAC